MICRISSSRPRIGSILPDSAMAVMSVEKRPSAVWLRPGAPASPPEPAAGAEEMPEPSIGRRFSSSDCAQTPRASLASWSPSMAPSEREASCTAWRSSWPFSAASRTWPVRICTSPNSKVA